VVLQTLRYEQKEHVTRRLHLYGDIYSSPGLGLAQKQVLMCAFLGEANMHEQLFGHLLAVRPLSSVHAPPLPEPMHRMTISLCAIYLLMCMRMGTALAALSSCCLSCSMDPHAIA
jgi:hypothetical protein